MSARRRWVRLATALAVAVMAGSLSACTPADEPVTALRNVDGHPTLLIVSCAKVRIDLVSVYGEGSTRDGTFQPGPKWTVGGYGEEIRGELRLLDSSTSLPVVADELTAFTPGTEYNVAAAGDPDAIPIHFTLEDLAALAPGQVLVGQIQNKRKAVAERDFQKKARESC